MNDKEDCFYEPQDVFLDSHVMSMQFSPTANVLAVGQITGEVRIYSYKSEQT